MTILDQVLVLDLVPMAVQGLDLTGAAAMTIITAANRRS
jgi:hypothetical protein